MYMDLDKRIQREGYFNNMNKADLLARQYTTQDEARSKYFGSLRSPNVSEKRVLEFAVAKANAIMHDYPKLANLPWTFLIAPDFIESGFPHTHYETIILPHSHVSRKSIDDLVDTLIHEKVHIYQRLYPCECNILFTRFWNLKIIGKKQTLQLHRSNPDINMLDYAESGHLIKCFYKDKHNPTLASITGDERDHPYEMMAYIIAFIMTRNTRLGADNGKYVTPTLQWMQEFLI